MFNICHLILTDGDLKLSYNKWTEIDDAMLHLPCWPSLVMKSFERLIKKRLQMVQSSLDSLFFQYKQRRRF